MTDNTLENHFETVLDLALKAAMNDHEYDSIEVVSHFSSEYFNAKNAEVK